LHERQTETRKRADERSNGSASVTDLAATASTGMAIYVTVNGREIFRVREALAGCRGAALTRVSVMTASARYYKHTSCPEKFVQARCCRFRAQRKNGSVERAHN
jgi:hypothetical protein